MTKPSFLASLPSPASANARGILWMAAAAPCFVGMNIAVRLIGDDLHAFEIAFFRYGFALLLLVPSLVQLRHRQLHTRQPVLHVIRCVIHLAGLILLIQGLRVVPLAEVSALGFTTPLFAALGAILLFGEANRGWRWGALLFGFAGALVIARPGFAELNWGTLALIGWALLFAVSRLISKILLRTDSSMTLVAYFSFILTLLALVPALFVWRWPSAEQFVWLVVLGGFGNAGHLMLARAFKVAEVSAVQAVDFTQLVWAALAGYLLFAESPVVWTWIGGLMIVGAAAYLARRESQLGGGNRSVNRPRS